MEVNENKVETPLTNMPEISDNDLTENSDAKTKNNFGRMKQKFVINNQTFPISSNNIEQQQPFETNINEIFSITQAEPKNEHNLKSQQISSAKHSLQTNLALITLFFFVLVFLYFIPNQQFLSVLIFSMLKGALPIFTTVANFGTIRSVIRQYYEYLKNFC
jgi:ABC-type multidrug transport system permease subunit